MFGNPLLRASIVSRRCTAMGVELLPVVDAEICTRVARPQQSNICNNDASFEKVEGDSEQKKQTNLRHQRE